MSNIRAERDLSSVGPLTKALGDSIIESMTRTHLATALVTVFALLVTPIGPFACDAYAVSAADRARAEATALEAKFKFKAEDYEGAARLFLQAFTVSRSPALLYNAARAFEEARKLKQARAAFEQYLDLRGVTGAGRRDARAKITALTKQIDDAKLKAAAQRQAQMNKVRAADGAKTVETARAAKPPTPQGATPASPMPVNEVVTRAPKAADAKSDTLTWSLMGGGGAAALLGMLIMGSGAAAQSKANNSTDWGAENAKANYLAASKSAGSTWGGGFLLMSAGLGVATWGVIRWRAAARATAQGSPRRPNELTVVPSLLRDHHSGDTAPGLVLGGRF